MCGVHGRRWQGRVGVNSCSHDKSTVVNVRNVEEMGVQDEQDGDGKW